MRGHRFTIYDAMEKNGYFDSNPANSFARDLTTGENLFLGPVEYPKMLYHPEGEEKITVPAEVISTPMGPKAVGEQREMINLIVKNKAEDEAAAAEGWWDHPAKAVRRRVEMYLEAAPDLAPKERAKLMSTIPTISAVVTQQDRIRELERQIADFEEGKKVEGPKVDPRAPLQPAKAANALGARFNEPAIL